LNERLLNPNLKKLQKLLEPMKLYLPHQWKFLIPIATLLVVPSAAKAQDSASATNPPLVVVVAPDPVALEGTSSGAFTLIRYGPTTEDLAVNILLSGTASNGVDYVTISNVITIPAGALATDVEVDPIATTTATSTAIARRGNKTVILTLDTNSDYRLGQHRWAAVKLIDDVFDFLPPTITLSSPTNGSVFTNPPSIDLTADVIDPGVSIKSVSFYANDNFLGHVTSAPFSLIWSNPPGGRFVLFARAVDQFDRSALSAPVHIAVTDVVPVVKLTSPKNGENFITHQDITLAAEASDADPNETIASVSFYANDRLLGKATKAPYSLVWKNVPSGLFALRAVAIDSSGDKGSSKPVVINVSPFRPKEKRSFSISR
jgi:hypothetical protein